MNHIKKFALLFLVVVVLVITSDAVKHSSRNLHMGPGVVETDYNGDGLPDEDDRYVAQNTVVKKPISPLVGVAVSFSSPVRVGEWRMTTKSLLVSQNADTTGKDFLYVLIKDEETKESYEKLLGITLPENDFSESNLLLSVGYRITLYVYGMGAYKNGDEESHISKAYFPSEFEEDTLFCYQIKRLDLENLGPMAVSEV